MSAVHWEADCRCYREGPLRLDMDRLDADSERFYTVHFPHIGRYGFTETINVGPEPHTSDGPWQAQCACGYRGSVSNWYVANSERTLHEYTDSPFNPLRAD